MARELEAALAEVPILDVHTHLVGGKLAAGGLHDIMLYHMVISDLYAAGCPSGARLTQYPNWPTREEAEYALECLKDVAMKAGRFAFADSMFVRESTEKDRKAFNIAGIIVGRKRH